MCVGGRGLPAPCTQWAGSPFHSLSDLLACQAPSLLAHLLLSPPNYPPHPPDSSSPASLFHSPRHPPCLPVSLTVCPPLSPPSLTTQPHFLTLGLTQPSPASFTSSHPLARQSPSLPAHLFHPHSLNLASLAAHLPPHSPAMLLSHFTCLPISGS